ncbi:MAG: hypothetical protein HYS12_10095 [Planctomycetes bacterium]|nr:hypothetical protein [Planctomycetota bacterium]
MKFLVNLASEGAVSKRPPCKGAVRGPESPAWPGEYQWFIELSSLDDLIALLNETGGALGLFTPEEDEEYPVLEVFDEDEQAD